MATSKPLKNQLSQRLIVIFTILAILNAETIKINSASPFSSRLSDSKKSTWDLGAKQKSIFDNMFSTNDFFSKNTPSPSKNLTGNNIIQGSNNSMKGT